MASPTNSTATTLQPPPPSAPGAYPVSMENVGIIIGAIVVAVGGIIKGRKMLSNSSLSVSQDRQEGKLLELSQTREKQAHADAREAWSQLNSLQKHIGELTAENNFYKRELLATQSQLAEIRQGVQGVGQMVDKTKTALDKTEKRISESGMSPLERK